MAMSKKKAQISNQCLACGCCVKVCPLKIITVYKGVCAVVDEQKCVGCGKCENFCPALVISIVEREVADNGAEEALV